VPLIPDMNSVVSVSSIDAFFEHNGGASASPALPNYVLNQFDPRCRCISTCAKCSASSWAIACCRLCCAARPPSAKRWPRA
jgi:hypothetical protein